MKALRMLIPGTLSLLVVASPAFAVDTAKVYNSGILVIVFLGFLALVVLAQLLPAIIMLMGMVRGLVKSAFESRKVEANVHSENQ